MLEALEALGIEARLHAVLPGKLVAEDHVTLQDALAAALRGERALVFDALAGVVQEDAGECQVGVDLRVVRKQRAGGPGHVQRVLEQPVAVGMVHRHGGGHPAEDRADLLEDPAHGEPQLVVTDGVDAVVEFLPHRLGVLGGGLDERVEHARGGERGLIHHDGAGEARGEAALVKLDPALDAHHAAFAGAAERLMHRAVAEDRAAERARPVAEVDAEVGVAVAGRLRLELPHDQRGGEGAAVVGRLHGLQVTDDQGGDFFGHGFQFGAESA